LHTPTVWPERILNQGEKMATTPVVPVVLAKETLKQRLEGDVKKVVKVLDLVGKDAEKGLVFLQKYAAPIDAIVALAFPGAGAGFTAGFTAVDLVQQAVLEVKAKSAMLPAGLPADQMIADEVQIVGPAVIALVNKEFPNYSTAQVQNLINLVIAAINAPPTA
jgi:hypothetical protein